MDKSMASWPRLLRHEREIRGWSQEHVANRININPKTVGRWERGEVRPSLECRVLLCRLYKKDPTELGLVEDTTIPPVEGGKEQQTGASTLTMSQPAEFYHVDWGEAPYIRHLFGRDQECARLVEWITEEKSNVLTLLGSGGIGKTTLAAFVTRQVANQFEYVFWRSLQNTIPLSTFLHKCILLLSNNEQVELPESIDEKISLALGYMRKYRCLLVLDNLETLLRPGDETGNWLAGYEEYGWFIKQLAEVEHSSCLILTSREKPGEVVSAERGLSPVHSLRLTGLQFDEARQMLEGVNLSGSEEGWRAFIYLYSGNPLALKMVAGTIQELFDGEITRFLREGMAVFGDVYDLMKQQFHRLSTAEQEILYWLAIEREPVTLDALREDILRSVSKGVVWRALASLQKRSMIETSQMGFSLQPVIMEYVTHTLVEHIYHEIDQQEPKLLVKHALLLAQAKDYLRANQARLILTPLAHRLLDTLGQEAVAVKCKNMLTVLRRANVQQQSYAAGNLLNLLLHMGYDLYGYDFSHVQVRQAYLQNKPLPAVNLTGSEILSSLFTDTFGNVLSVAFSPDGSLLAAGTASCDIRIWQRAQGTARLTLKGHDHWVWSIAFSPDGRFLASGSIDQTVRLWDVLTGEELHICTGHTNRVRTVAFSPDGQVIASGSNDRTIRLWDVQTGQCLHVIKAHKDWVWSVMFSPDGSLLASASADHTICLWDRQTKHLLNTLEGHTDRILALAFSLDGRLLASGGGDLTVRVWDVRSGNCQQILLGHTHWIRSVAFAPDRSVVASGGDDRIIRFWDLESGRCRTTFQGHTNWVRSIAFSPDGLWLASGSDDQTVRLWEIATEHSLSTFQGYVNGITSAAYSPDGTLVACGSEDRTVRLWDAESGTCLDTLAGHAGWVWSVAFHPDPATHILASGSNDHTVRLWDISTGVCLRQLEGHADWIWSIAFSPDGSLLASGSEDQTIRLWNTRTGECLRILYGHVSSVGAVIFGSDGRTLASSGGDATVRLWDAQTGACLRIQTFAERSSWVAFSPRKSVLASASTDQAIHLFATDTGNYIKKLYGHTGVVRSVAFNVDGTLLASCGYDQTIRLWDVQSGTCLHILYGHTDWVRSVAFSPDGHSIVSGSKDGTIKYWSVQTGICFKTLRNQRLYENMNITNIKGLTDAQKDAIKLLGAMEEKQPRGAASQFPEAATETANLPEQRRSG